MKVIKKLARVLLYFVLGLSSFLALYLLCAWALSRISIDAEVAKPEIPLYILTNGVHTDLVLPIRYENIDWTEDIKFENTTSHDTAHSYVAFGWGDKGFYLETPSWSDLTFSTAFKAVFFLSSSAIHATFYKELRESPHCVKTYVSREQYKRLVSYIKNTLQRDAKGASIAIATNANYGLNDAFYEARGTYSLFTTCNTWANSGLKCCGLKACLWTPFEGGIFYQYGK